MVFQFLGDVFGVFFLVLFCFRKEGLEKSGPLI